MKKLMITLLTCLAFSASIAQINRGAWLISGSSNLGINNLSFQSGNDAFLFNLNSKTGYFVVNNLALGLNTGFFSASQSGNSGSQTTIGAFARYYFPKNFFVGAGVTSVTSSGTGITSTSSTQLPFEVGFAWFISKSFAMEPSLNYVQGDDKSGLTVAGYQTGAKSAVGLNLAFTVYLNRNQDEK